MPMKDIDETHCKYIKSSTVPAQSIADLSRKAEHSLFDYQLLGEFDAILKLGEMSNINSYLYCQMRTPLYIL